VVICPASDHYPRHPLEISMSEHANANAVPLASSVMP